LHRVGSGSLAFTTDSFVVKPLRFPGGSIGELAVNGTVNDLAVSGGSDFHGDGTRRSEFFGVVSLPREEFDRLASRA
jgi:hypothetical protein